MGVQDLGSTVGVQRLGFRIQSSMFRVSAGNLDPERQIPHNGPRGQGFGLKCWGFGFGVYTLTPNGRFRTMMRFGLRVEG